MSKDCIGRRAPNSLATLAGAAARECGRAPCHICSSSVVELASELAWNAHPCK